MFFSLFFLFVFFYVFFSAWYFNSMAVYLKLARTGHMWIARAPLWLEIVWTRHISWVFTYFCPKQGKYVLVLSGWRFGTFFHLLGMSSSQLTNSNLFQRGMLKPPTSYDSPLLVADTSHFWSRSARDHRSASHEGDRWVFRGETVPGRSSPEAAIDMKKGW